MLILQKLAINSGKNPHYRAIGNVCVTMHLWVVNLINEKIQAHTGLFSADNNNGSYKWGDKRKMFPGTGRGFPVDQENSSAGIPGLDIVY